MTPRLCEHTPALLPPSPSFSPDRLPSCVYLVSHTRRARESLGALGLISVQPQMHRCTTVQRSRIHRTRESAGGGKERGNDVVEEGPVPTLPAVWFPRFLSPVYNPGRPSLVHTDRRYRQVWQSTPVSYLTRFATLGPADAPVAGEKPRDEAQGTKRARCGECSRVPRPAAATSRERGEHKNSLRG